jgi:hypothetical protein
MVLTGTEAEKMLSNGVVVLMLYYVPVRHLQAITSFTSSGDHCVHVHRYGFWPLWKTWIPWSDVLEDCFSILYIVSSGDNI